MKIAERLATAIHTWQALYLKAQASSVCDSKPGDTFDIAHPNVTYLGQVEYHDVIRERVAQMPDRDGTQRVMGMTIIRVHLESYLQVAYVEGVK